MAAPVPVVGDRVELQIRRRVATLVALYYVVAVVRCVLVAQHRFERRGFRVGSKDWFCWRNDMSETPITDGYEWASWPGMTMPAECCRDLERSRDQWRRMCTVLAGQLQQWVEAFDGESNDFELGQDIEAIRQYLAMFEREKGKQNVSAELQKENQR